MGDTMSERYNGWKNRETWLCKHWLDNDGDLEYFERYAQSMLDDGRDACDVIECVAGDIALSFAERAEEQLSGIGFLTDLMNNALRSVDYREVASSIVDDVVATNNN